MRMPPRSNWRMNEEFAILYKEQIKKYNYKLDDLEDGLTRAYSLIWSDYMTISMQYRIEQHPEFASKIKGDPILSY
jgi:hypothetical protein